MMLVDVPERSSPDRPLRLKAIAKLGGHCVGTTCRWHNEDGTIGCNDERALHFHHKDGGGSAARKQSKDSLRQIYFQVLNGSLRFELLCACCHEIISKPQKQGARLHRQAARVRRSKQIAGKAARRVRETQELIDQREQRELLELEKSFLAARERQKTEKTTT
jgi:hypothetical protein